MRILFLSRWYPYPADNGSKIRIYNLLKHLSVRHEISLLSFAPELVDDERKKEMLKFCKQVEIATYRPFNPTRVKALLGYFSLKPRSVVDTFNTEMQQHIEHLRQERTYDLVIASEIDMAPYAAMIDSVPRIFEDIELTPLYERYIRQPNPIWKVRNGFTWIKTARYTNQLLQNFDGVTVVSRQEKHRVEQVSPGYSPIQVVPNCVDVEQYNGDFGSPEPDTLVFSGSLTYKANFDAVDYFVHDIFPLVKKECPQVKFIITGRLDGVPLDRLPKNDGVVFTGFLLDVRPRVARSWVNVVPLRIGGGTRLKILESLALGTPVVSTGKGAEGLDLIPGRDLLIADSPVEFAASILRLLQDASLREELSRAGRKTVIENYDWGITAPDFCGFVEEVATKGRKL